VHELRAARHALLNGGHELGRDDDVVECECLDLALEALHDPSEQPLLDRALPRDCRTPIVIWCSP
jgi:hypothetical protein